MNIQVEINGSAVNASHGETILQATEREGIRIPTLCHMKDFLPDGACRLCVVELEESQRLVSACSFPLAAHLKIRTHSPRVVEARKTILELLLSNHPDDCLYCIRNGNCELQHLSAEYHINERKLCGKKTKHLMDISSPSLQRDPDKCVLCGRCVRVCEEIMGVACIDFIHRGCHTTIGPAIHSGLNASPCVQCGQCIMHCPTAALTEKNQTDLLHEVLQQSNKVVVAQYAPSVPVSIAEAFGMKAGKDITGLLNAALRKIGFHYVFDTSFAADLTIMEESEEFLQRFQSGTGLPMFSSCCPAWVNYAETFAPEILPQLSTCKSPQQMMGALIKSYFAEQQHILPEHIFSVSIMPCIAKKQEAKKSGMGHDGMPDVDLVISTRELIELIRMYGIELQHLQPEQSDAPLGVRSSAGKIFGTSGGVMEAALRTAYSKITGKEMLQFKMNELREKSGIKEMRLDIEGSQMGVAAVSGLSNAVQLLADIKAGHKDLAFVEVMSCPGGCISGGGQCIGASGEIHKARKQSLYVIDEKESLKVSHKNPDILELYSNFLHKPLSEVSHHLLHTSYTSRSKYQQD